MKVNCGRVLVAQVQELDMGNIKCGYSTYTYKGDRAPFVGGFRFVLPRLHDILFGEIILSFYSVDRNKRYLKGVVKMKIQQFLTNGFKRKQRVAIAAPEYLHKSDFYDKNFRPIGTAKMLFRIENNTEGLPQPSADTPNRLLNLVFVEEKAQMLKIAYEMFLATQKGTFSCRISWLMGLPSINYYYTHVYGRCVDESGCLSSSTPCGSKLCINSYGPLSKEELEEAFRLLQYASASFANGVITWRLDKLRTCEDIKDPRRRAILERIDVPEADLLGDVHGDDRILSHIWFARQDEMVVSFKGTTSLSEAMFDLNCDYTEFQDGYVHRGFKVLCDRWIEECWLPIYKESEARGIRKLLLTGQSLGGAASIIVFLRLREMLLPGEMAIRVVCFGPPPVVSKSIAEKSFPEITIYCYGSDFVTRLCFGSILDLKFICISISSLYDFFVDRQQVMERIGEINEYLRANNMYPKLYHPGRLVHIRDFRESGKSQILYREVYHTFFEEFICTRTAPFDHLIHRTMQAFKSSLKEESTG